jgi:hypothetical protein
MTTQSDALRLADRLESDFIRSQTMVDAAAELRHIRAQRDALLEALKSTGLFLHHCWCDVQMNDYSFEKLNQQMQVVDTAIAAVEETK